MARGPRICCTVEYRPTAHRTRAPNAARTWRGCVVDQRGTRSSPRRRPRNGRTNTATGRRHRVRTATVHAFNFHGARPARLSSRGDSADCPRSACAVQCGLGINVFRPNAGRAGVPLSTRRMGLGRINTATGRQHGYQKVVISAFKLRGARPARFPPRGVSADRPWSTPAAQCGLGVLAWYAPPHAVGRGSAAPPPRQVGEKS